jgi:hypothetical protein
MEEDWDWIELAINLDYAVQALEIEGSVTVKGRNKGWASSPSSLNVFHQQTSPQMDSAGQDCPGPIALQVPPARSLTGYAWTAHP